MRRLIAQKARLSAAADAFTMTSARCVRHVASRATLSSFSCSQSSPVRGIHTGAHPTTSRPLLYVGSGSSSPGLLGCTRVARLPPQLARLLIMGGAALSQVFITAFLRESQRLRHETEATTGMAEGERTARAMSGVEALQVLGLDRGCPEVFSAVQQAESRASSSGSGDGRTASLLPLAEGKAREQARRSFERMFALAIKEENLFLAGKLSAAYRICVDPEWDQIEEVSGGGNPSETAGGQDGESGAR